MSARTTRLHPAGSGDPASGLSRRAARALGALPPVGLAAYWVLLAVPATEPFAIALVQENRPVELLTFLFLLWAGARGVGLSRRAQLAGARREVSLFFLLFSASLVFIAMEEIAWGQQFFHFETPEELARVNRQGEVTLHNIGPLQGRSELFRLVFGVGGLVGIWLASRPHWAAIGVPAVLLPWFATITLAALIDLHADYSTSFAPAYDQAWRWASEMVEMLIGAAALLYIEMKSRLPIPESAGLSVPAATTARAGLTGPM